MSSPLGKTNFYPSIDFDLLLCGTQIKMENATDTIHRPGFYTIDIVETQGHYTANIAESQGFTQQTIEEDQYMQRKYSKDLNVSFLHQNQPDLDFGTIITVGASRFIPRQALLYTSHNRSLQQKSQQTHNGLTKRTCLPKQATC